MIEQIITKGSLTFNDLEANLFRRLCGEGCKILREMLESIDQEIKEGRDCKVYENLGLKATHIETLMGRVNFKRREYSCYSEDGRKEYKFLLDEELKIFNVGKISAALIEVMATQLTIESFRNAANAVSIMTGIRLSHGSIWNITQKVGEAIKKEEDQKIALLKAGQITGKKEVDVLFEEADGVYLKLQGKDRKRFGKTRELKVAVTYEGWEKNGKKGFKLAGKRVCSSFEDSNKFRLLKESMIASEYNTDAIKFRIQNGDGASWIHDGNDETIISQLDPFHVKKALVRNIQDKPTRKIVGDLLNKKEIDLALDVVEALGNSVSDERQQKKIHDLHTYFNSNKAIIIPYRDRGIVLPAPPEGLEFRGMGTMEHHICDVIAQRMKGRKGSWSIQGGSNMAKTLSAKVSKTLYDIIRKRLTPVIPEKYEAIVHEILSASKAPQRDGKGSDGNIRHGGMPFRDSFVTPGRKAIQDMLRINYSLH